MHARTFPVAALFTVLSVAGCAGSTVGAGEFGANKKLFEAVLNEDYDGVVAALQEGANPNARSPEGDSRKALGRGKDQERCCKAPWRNHRLSTWHGSRTERLCQCWDVLPYNGSRRRHASNHHRLCG